MPLKRVWTIAVKVDERFCGDDERLNERPSSRDKGATADHEAGREELRSGA
jgi:hypothetical protein